MKRITDLKNHGLNDKELTSICGGAVRNVQVTTSRFGNTITAVFYDDANGNGRLDNNEAVLDIQRYEVHAK
ncbi:MULTISPECIES: hypothetical protein [unclassified Flavobacterium]|uniref:hypothetical protein n=1 Tax=unclassified Flavobacterium TaxID=196869 RepID=UPI00361D5FD7